MKRLVFVLAVALTMGLTATMVSAVPADKDKVSQTDDQKSKDNKGESKSDESACPYSGQKGECQNAGGCPNK